MAKKGSITIKQLHARTGEYVRRAGRGRTPLTVTDRGKVVAALVAPRMVPPGRRRRTVLPEYAAFLTRRQSNDILCDLDAVRGDR
ncbi:type II toxin-antitoxin system prevent-host-death family antitoxin [Candidatus Binatia bacterium]|nr:type II toxin-antitoxin system prevent-host-death family antitoxin [Candidatus Binatia bacterium]